MKRLTLFVASAFAIALNMAALTVNPTQPGMLNTLVPNDVADLKIVGPIDAADFQYLNDKCSALTALDLADATIAEYHGETINGLAYYPAASIPAAALSASTLRTIVLPQAPTTVADCAFMNSQLTDITIPANITITGQGVFAGCPNLATATINADIAQASHLFDACPALTTVTLNGVTSLPEAAFKDCTALTTVNGSNNLTNIQADAFKGCSALANITFGSGLQTIGDRAFQATALETVNLSMAGTLDNIGTDAFAHCHDLTTAILPSGLQSMGQGTFFDCPALAIYATPVNVSTLARYQHYGNTSLDTPDILHEGITTIEPYALSQNTATTHLTLPKALEYIGSGAMSGMTGLQQLTATDLKTVPALGSEVWRDVDQHAVVLQVDTNVKADFEAAPQWQDFEIVGVPSGVTDIEDSLDNFNIKAAFHGQNLLVQSAGQPIARLMVYNTAGSLLIDRPANDNNLTVDASALNNGVYVLYVRLADNTTAALKTQK